jgi:hypothetical protein
MKTSIIIFIALISFTSFSQVDCTKFKTGKFVNIDKDKPKTTIERNDSIQTERMGEIEVKLEITWINECTYKLKLVSGNNAFWKSRPKNTPNRELIVTITKTTNTSYFQEAKSEGDDYVYKSEIIMVE